MKNLIKVSLLALVLGIGLATTASAEFVYYFTGSGDGDYILFNPETQTVLSASSEKLTSVVIPSEIEGIPVKYIQDAAFSYNHTATEYIIPASVESIGAYAFNGDYVTSLVFLGSDIYFDGAPIRNTGLLANISAPNYSEIGENYIICNGTFFGYVDDGAEEFTVPDGVTSIGKSAFRGVDSLVTVNIPEGVTRIQEEAFYKCTGLTSITLPASMEVVETYAFYGCYKLVTLTLESADTFFDGVHFSSASNNRQITEVTSPDPTTGFQDGYLLINGVLFRASSATGEFVVPDGITGIGGGAFYESSVEKIVIPDSVSYIGKSAFYKCQKLTDINIPEAVTSINSNTFYYCISLETITLPSKLETIGFNSFYHCSALSSITLPDTLTSLGESAFSKCSALTEVTIPSLVASIGPDCFYQCDGLVTVTIPGYTSTIGSQAFAMCPNVTLYSSLFSATHSYANDDNIPFADSGEEYEAYASLSSIAGSSSSSSYADDGDYYEDDYYEDEGTAIYSDSESKSSSPVGAIVVVLALGGGAYFLVPKYLKKK